MKKILIFALVLGLAVMFAVPAFAFKIEGGKDTSFYFGALIYTDLGIWDRSKELAGAPNKSDRVEGILTLARHSRLRGNLDVGNVGAYFEIRPGADNEQTASTANPYYAPGGSYIEGSKLYGYYKFGNCVLLAGKTDGHFYSVAPYQNLGFQNNNHIAGFGWGNIYDQRSAQVRFSQDVSKTFGYDLSIVQSQYYMDNGVGNATGLPGTGTGAVQSIMTWPLTALKVRLNFGIVSLMPAAYVQYVKWNDLPATPLNTSPDDNMTSWAAVLPIVVKAGAFTGTFQGLYGQNLGSRNGGFGGGGPLALENAYHGYARTINGAVKNTTGINAFFDLAFTAGAVTPHFYVGYDKAENTDVYVGDKYNVRMMYGVGINWKIADSFYVVPEFTFYDYGKNPTVAGNPDLGKEWLGGVQFQFVF